MTDTLHNSYAVLLRCYPADYRRERGDEMLATLVDCAAPGQRRPTMRETAALIRGGLRARAGIATRRTPRQLWLSATKMTALALLVYAAAQTVGHLLRIPLGMSKVEFGGLDSYILDFGPDLLVLSLYGAAIVSIAADHHLRGAALALAGFLPATLLFHQWSVATQLSYGEFWPIPVAIPLTLALARARHVQPGRPGPWLLLVLPAVVLLPTDASYHWELQPWTGVAVVVAGLLWAVLDVRVSIAMIGLAATNLLNAVGWNATTGSAAGAAHITLDLALAAAPGAIVLLAADLQARRESTL
jgi:hypothetical protein